MKKGIRLLGLILWILGLVLSIVGLNVPGTAGTWMAVIGNILFLVGLGVTGYFWLREKRPSRGKTDMQEG